MDVNIYSVYDKLAEEAGPLFEQKNDATAMRAYKRLFSDEKASRLEYKLLFLGTFNKKTCKINFLDIPKEVYLPEERIEKEDVA